MTNKISQPIPMRHLVYLLGVAGVIALVFFVYTKNRSLISQSTLYPVPLLNQIVPGKTALEEALTILGNPNSVEDSLSHPTRMINDIFDLRPDLKVYIFQNTQGWWWTELWVQNKDEKQIVIAVLRIGQLAPKPEKLHLDIFATEYGRPDEVTWTPFCNLRYLIWSQNGVAVNAETPKLVLDNGIRRSSRWNELIIAEIFLFEPMELVKIINFRSWPWPSNGAGWSFEKMCAGDVLDNLPKDPFDWENIPTPSP